MNRSLLLPAAYLVDQAAGDPESFPHPVRLIGSAISRGESLLRYPDQSEVSEFASGLLLTAIVVGSTYCLSAGILQASKRSSRFIANAVELALAWTCLAARNLQEEATAVTGALQSGNLPLARTRLSRIVGRDTASLDSHQMGRAVIETVAESTSDGIIAPLFYMAFGGVPLAMAYKAINTLDSMIGHADHRYFYFGKAAARLDDAANYIPSRLSALCIVAASQFSGQSRTAWTTWRRDGSKHKSPNAGQPESAMAGALSVSLGGENTYAGELISTPRIGEEFPASTQEKAVQAIRLAATASLIGLTAGVLLLNLTRGKKRR